MVIDQRLIFVPFLLIHLICNSQSVSNKIQLKDSVKTDTLTDNYCFDIPVDRIEKTAYVYEKPSFYGGDEITFKEYVIEKLINIETRYINTSAKLEIQYVLNKRGRIEDARILKSDCLEINDVILQIIFKSPLWTPAKLDNRLMFRKFNMLIDFSEIKLKKGMKTKNTRR